MCAAQSVPECLARFGAIVVTGASSGIGEEFVTSISTINPRALFFNLSRTSPKNNLAPGRLTHFPADLSTAAGQDAAAAAAAHWLDTAGGAGEVLLINNSGFGTYGPFPEPNLDRTLAMVDLNMRAPVHLTGHLLPRLLQRGGAVINLASTAAFQPMPFFGVYAATKSFVLNWSLSLWRELLGTKVHVLCVCPGPTSTQFFRAAGFSEPPVSFVTGQTSPQVVTVSLRALARHRPLVVSGWTNKIGALIGSRLPRVWMTRLTYLIMQKMRLDPKNRSKNA